MNDALRFREPCQNCTKDEICDEAERARDELWEILSKVVGMPWEEWAVVQQDKYIGVHSRMRGHVLGQAQQRDRRG